MAKHTRVAAGIFFDVGETVPRRECEALGVDHREGYRVGDCPPRRIKAVWTGERRPPRKGEWYLSGALVEAYLAPGDLDAPRHIARLVKVTEVTATLEDKE